MRLEHNNISVIKGFLSKQEGMTLMELLIGMSMALVVMTGLLPMFEIVGRQQPRIYAHGSRVIEAQTALERVTRDLRQVYSVNYSSSSSLDVLTYVRSSAGQPAQQWRVVIDCSSGSCTWQEGAVGGQLGTAQTLIANVKNSDIFTYLPDNVNPHYLQVKFTFDVKYDAADPQHDVTLSDGVNFRNVSAPG